MKQAFSLGCDFKEDGNGMPPSQEVAGGGCVFGIKGSRDWPLPGQRSCEAAAWPLGWASQKQLPGLGVVRDRG